MDYARSAILGTLVGVGSGMLAQEIQSMLPKLERDADPKYEDHQKGIVNVLEFGVDASLSLAVSAGGLYVGDMLLDRVLTVDPTQGLYFSFGFMSTQQDLLTKMEDFIRLIRAYIVFRKL